ncbi:hypothetical protein NGUA38_01260 [Salmonella enterica]|nr:hypothetical protein NGUA38_01260 [Salmonella enterica]
MLPPLVTLLAPLLIRMPLSLATIALPLSVVIWLPLPLLTRIPFLPEISPPEVVTILLLPLIRRPSLTPVIFPWLLMVLPLPLIATAVLAEIAPPAWLLSVWPLERAESR